MPRAATEGSGIHMGGGMLGWRARQEVCGRVICLFVQSDPMQQNYLKSNKKGRITNNVILPPSSARLRATLSLQIPMDKSL